MRKLIGIILIIIIIALAQYIWKHRAGSTSDTLSTGIIEFNIPNNFGLAVTAEQVLVKSYIPPCNEGFDYCLYYNTDQFKNTNFESAGIRVQKRADLSTEQTCLNAPPSGYDATRKPDGMSSGSVYKASIFSKISDAGAGHYANGELYRIYTENICIEVETRIGETQFANYPAGTKIKFDENGRNVIYSGFNAMLNSLKLSKTGEKITLPASED